MKLDSLSLLAAGTFFLAMATTAFSAQAQTAPTQCGPRAQVVERLAGKYGETRQSIGLAANNSVLEVFASSETGSWTVTVTTPAGLTCLVASGQAFAVLAEALPPSGDPA